MKRWICLAAFLLSVPSLLPGFDFSASLKLGLAYPFYSGRDYEGWLASLESAFVTNYGYFVDYATRLNGKGLGLNAGLSVTLGLAEWFALQPEIFLSRFGGSYGFDDPTNFGEVIDVDRLRCFETMLLAALRLGRGKSRLNLFAGPAVALRWGEVRIKEYQEGQLIWEGIYVDTQFARMFLNLIAGAGVTWYLSNGMLLSLEARYARNLTGLMNETTTGITDWNQNAVQLMLGIGRILAGKGFVQRSNRR